MPALRDVQSFQSRLSTGTVHPGALNATDYGWVAVCFRTHAVEIIRDADSPDAARATLARRGWHDYNGLLFKDEHGRRLIATRVPGPRTIAPQQGKTVFTNTEADS